MRAHWSDRGGSAIEYAGLIVLTAVILGSLTTIGIPGAIRDGLTPALCKIAGGTSCGGHVAGGRNADSGRPSNGNPAPSSNRSPRAGEPGLAHSLGKTLGYHARGVEKFVGVGRASHQQPVMPFTTAESIGVSHEVWEQAEGIGSFAEMVWCSTGWCSDVAVKQARDGWSYIYHNPGEAAKQAGYSIVEPCVKAWRVRGQRVPDQNPMGDWTGRCTASIATTVVGTKGLGDASKLAKLAKLGKGAEEAGRLTKATKAADGALEHARGARDAAKVKDLPAGDVKKIAQDFQALGSAEKASFLDKLTPQELTDLWRYSDETTRSDILENASKRTLVRWNPPEPSFPGGGSWAPNMREIFRGGPKGEPKVDDIAQGRLGDCWCLSGMGAVAATKPKIIEKMIKQNPNGTYTVKFGDGKKVTVTNKLPANGARPVGAAWPQIMEKAFAQRYGGYDKIHGGNLGRSLEQITGKSPIYYAARNDDSGLTVITKKPSLTEIASKFEKGNAYSVGFAKDIDLPNAKARGIAGQHAYAVVGVDKAKGTVALEDPRGGRVTLTEQELKDKQVLLVQARY